MGAGKQPPPALWLLFPTRSSAERHRGQWGDLAGDGGQDEAVGWTGGSQPTGSPGERRSGAAGA